MRYATAYTYGVPLPGFENIASPSGGISVDTEGSRGYPSIVNGIPINFVGGVSDSYDDNGYIIISDTTTAGLVGRTTGGSGDTSNLPVVTIGTQSWMTSNLDVATYSNGDTIQQVTDPTAWSNLTTGAWCWYDNDSDNGAIYGKLYNWYAVNDPRGLAPTGYHVPTDAEWETLISTLGGLSVAGGVMKEAGTTHWIAPNTDATNISGFTALPGGLRNEIGVSRLIAGNGHWWSSTEIGSTTASSYSLGHLSAAISKKDRDKKNGFSVRCIKDNNSGIAQENVPTFWVSKLKTDISFLNLVNNLPQRSGESAFANNAGGLFGASNWLSSNGYWTSYIAPILSLDAGNTASYSLDNATIWRDLVDGKEFDLLGDQGLPTYQSGDGGKILFVATASHYAICNTSLIMSTGNNQDKFTLSIWHYWKGNNTGENPCIISEIYSGGPIYYLLGNLGSGLQGGYFDGGFKMSPTFSLTPNNWYHIVITCDVIANFGEGQVIKAYVNNTLVGTTQTSTSDPAQSGNGIHLMRRWDLADFWDGYLAKVDIYNRALSQRQITSIWNSNRSRFYNYINITDSISSNNTIQLTINAVDSSPITDTGTAFKTSTPVIITDNPQSEGSVPNGVYQQTRTSLSPQTRYYLAAYKTTSAGTVLSSEVTKFTLSNPPITQASSLSANAFSSTQINLSWSPADFPTGGATAKRYILLRAVDPNVPVFTGTNASAPTVGANTFIVNSNIIGTEANDFNLTALTTYNYLLIPYTWDGINPETYNYLTLNAPTASGTTSDILAPTMTLPTSASITNNTVILGATIVTSGSSAIIQRGTIYSTISPVSVSSNILDDGGTSLGAYSMSRVNLLPETKYYFNGYSVNADGGIAIVPEEASFFTWADPPSTATSDLTATAISSTQINLNWTRPNYPSEGATSKNYVIIRSIYPNVPTLVNTNGQAPAVDANTTIVTSTILSSNNSYSVTGLQTATRYNFSIIPYTWNGVNDPTRNYYTSSALVVDTTTF